MNADRKSKSTLSRRNLLGAATGVAAVAMVGKQLMAIDDKKKDQEYQPKGNIKHSIVQWCFADHFSVDELCGVAAKLGCESVEIVGPEEWPTLKKHGLTCTIAPSHLFMQGMNNPKYQPACLDLMRKRIDECADADVPTVITFTGYAEESGPWADGTNPDVSKLPKDRPVIDPEQGLKNCVDGYKKIVGYAEQKGVNLSLEMLNTRADDHPMKGHPGYQGNHIDYCREIVQQVGSPRLGLLFDIYHVQIMDGDLVRRVKQCGETINHVHTAGNPGRGELDKHQEINYRPVMKALQEIGYEGYVGHEFIPTRDPMAGLRQAVKTCDV